MQQVTAPHFHGDSFVNFEVAQTSYYRARYYDQTTGRFLSEDPISFKGGIDFYEYVDNEATKSRDPFGLRRDPPPQRPYANTTVACDQQFQECKNRAKDRALKGGFIVFIASAVAFDTAIIGCVALTGPAAVACVLAVEEVQLVITPILLAPFGGNYFGNVADCWNQKAKCLAQQCKK
jgi:RHS repeat-associated protein